MRKNKSYNDPYTKEDYLKDTALIYFWLMACAAMWILSFLSIYWTFKNAAEFNFAESYFDSILMVLLFHISYKMTSVFYDNK